MPDISVLKDRLMQLQAALEQRLPDIAITLSLAAKALAERNIKEAGFGKAYSTNQVPAFFFFGKELNASGLAFLEKRGVTVDGKKGEAKKKRRKKGQTEDPGVYDTTTNWGEFREAQGLQNDFVDLSYSNKMWANMQPTRVEARDHIYIAPLGATNVEAQNKMNWNFARYGDFVGKALDGKAREILTRVVVDEILLVFDEFKP